MADADFAPLRVTYRAPALGRTQIKDWARANGYLVSERGGTPPEITEAFFAAHPEILERARTFEMVRATARTPDASPEDYEWQEDSPLRDIYTIVFVRGLDEREVLRRLGAADEDIRLIEDGDHSYPEGPEVITSTGRARIPTGSIVTSVSWASIRPPTTASTTPSRRPWHWPAASPASW